MIAPRHSNDVSVDPKLGVATCRSAGTRISGFATRGASESGERVRCTTCRAACVRRRHTHSPTPRRHPRQRRGEGDAHCPDGINSDEGKSRGRSKVACWQQRRQDGKRAPSHTQAEAATATAGVSQGLRGCGAMQRTPTSTNTQPDGATSTAYRDSTAGSRTASP